MPQQTFTPFDTAGQTKLTDMDQLAEQRRREMQDQAFRGALLNNQNNMQREGWGRQDALQGNALSAQERIAQGNNATQLQMGGSFQDRTAANQALAAQQMRPAQTMADLQTQQWQEGSGLRQSGNALSQEINNAKLGAIRGGMAGGGGNQRLAAALMGVNPDQLEDPQDRMVRAATLQALSQRLASGELDPGQFSAAAKGDYSAIPKRQVTAIAPEQQIAALEGTAQRFGERDAATFGFDPTEEDVGSIIRQRDQVAQALKSQRPQLSDEQAKEGANFYIEQKIAPNAERWGTGWIQRLREALRGGTPAAQPSQPAAGMDMGQWQG